jgi:hypothetical protein
VVHAKKEWKSNKMRNYNSLNFWGLIVFSFFLTVIAIISAILDFNGINNFYLSIILLILGIGTILFIAFEIILFKKKSIKEEKDSLMAKIAFFLSLFNWIPLFNFGIAPVSIYLAILAIKKQSSNPSKYGGLIYATLALCISSAALIITIIGLIIFYFFSDDICANSICQVYYNITV